MQLLTGLLALSSPLPWSGGHCEIGQSHRTLADAIADQRCEVVRIGPVPLFETVRIDRPLVLLGSGRDASVLYCADHPCLTVGEGAGRVFIGAMSIASTGPSFEARGGLLEVVGVRFSQLGTVGGEVRLRDTSARFTEVEIEAATLPALDAVSHFGNDLELERTVFLGVEPTSGTRGAIYGSTYSLRCEDCSFRPQREGRVASLLWDDEESAATWGRSGSHYWPQRDCPAADDEVRSVCRARCGSEEVALCWTTYRPNTQTCLPAATCVPTGQVPRPEVRPFSRQPTRSRRVRPRFDTPP